MNEERTSAPNSAGTTQRNVAFSTVNQFLVEAGMTLSEPSTVLTLFVKALGGSNFAVGLVPSIRFFGWLAPQFLVAGSMQRLTRFLPLVQVMEIIRSSFYLIIALVAVAYGEERPYLVLAVFFVLFIITRFAAGSSAVARAEIIARMVPPKQRSRLISMRKFAGGLAGLLSGFAVRYVLDEKVSHFPHNYAILIGVSGLSLGLALIVLSLVREPTVAIVPKGIHVLEQLKRAPALLRSDRRYSQYIAVRAASTGLQLAAPFYVIYATEVLGAPAAMVGIYIAIRTFARVASNLYWGRQCKVRGNLWVLKAGRILGIVAALIAALLPLITSLVWAERAPTWMASLFGLVFLTQGLSVSADVISRMSYLFEIAPAADRPTYFGLANTIVGPLYFLPLLSGALLDTVGFTPIFLVSAGSMVLAYALATKLK